jgi:ribonuclease J
VIPALEEIFEQAPGRLIITTFSSSIHRLQVVFDIANTFGRKVCVLGRSMQRNVEIAEEQGFLRFPEDVVIDLGQARQLEDDQIVYLITGSQAEPRAVMNQLATQGYKGLQIEKGDTIVLSARIIPGNERAISKMIGHIYKHGGNIIEEKRRLVHVSGHAAQEDIRIMVETARPKFVVPIHGEYRMLFRHKEFVKNHCGYEDENIILIENGDVLEFEDGRAAVVEKLDVGRVFVDEESWEELEYDTIRERKKMAFNGAIMLTITLDKKTKKLVGDPQFSFQGVAGIDETNGMIGDARKSIANALDNMKKDDLRNMPALKENLRIVLKRFIQKEAGGKPVIIPTIVEV